MNLGELLERTYRTIHDDIVDGVATAGTASVITDSAISGRYQASKFKNWVAFITRTTDGASPKNRYSLIASNTTTGVITLASSLTDVVDAGDEYALCKGSIPLYSMIKIVNDALKGLGRIPLVDTSLVLAYGVGRYNLPIAIKGKRPDLVYFRDSDSVRWDAPNYRLEPSAPGSANALIFDGTLTFASNVGNTIVIHYQGEHPDLTAYNSPISETIPDTLAVAACKYEALRWKVYPRQKKTDVANADRARMELEEARSLFPIERPTRNEQRVPLNMFNGIGRRF